MTRAQRYLVMLEKYPDNLDDSYYAAFYLISSDELLSERLCNCISPVGIDFPEMMNNCAGLDDTQQKILSIAHNLFAWESDCALTPHDLAHLGYPALDDVCGALHTASGLAGPQVQVNGLGKQVLSLDKSKYEQTRKLHNMLNDMQSAAFEESEDVERK